MPEGVCLQWWKAWTLAEAEEDIVEGIISLIHPPNAQKIELTITRAQTLKTGKIKKYTQMTYRTNSQR